MTARLPAQLALAVLVTLLSGCATPTSSPPGSPSTSAVLSDSFSRSVNGGWGTPDSGPAWEAVGTPEGASVDGASGRLTVAVAPGRQFMSAPLRTRDIEITGRWSLDALPTGAPASVHFYFRVNAADVYRFYVNVSPNGDLIAKFEALVGGTGMLLGSATRVGSGYVAGQWWHVHIQAQGSAPTTMGARVWRDGTPEPTDWTLETSDSSPTLQAETQSIRLGVFAADGATTLPLQAAYDDITVTVQP